MRNRSIKRASQVIAYILVVLLLVGVLGGIIYFTNFFQEDFSTVFIEVDGKRVSTEYKGYELSEKMSVKITSLPQSDYEITILPHIDSGKDFTFNVGENIISFSEVKDCSPGFVIDYSEDRKSFELTPKGTIDDLLKNIYPSFIDSCKDKIYEDMFELRITFSEIEKVISVYFYVPNVKLSLNYEGIVF